VDLRGPTSKGRGRKDGREGYGRGKERGMGPTSKAREERRREGGKGREGLAPKPKNQTSPMSAAVI